MRQSSFHDAFKPLWARTGELLWLLDYWDDVEADVLVFYRIDDIASYPDAAKFFRLAYRLPAYRGVIRERVTRDQLEEQERKGPRRAQGHSRPITDTAEQRGALIAHGAEAKSVEIQKGQSYLRERLKQRNN